VPAVSLIGTEEFVRGAVLVVLVVAFLRLERLRRRDAPAAGALAGGVAVAALLIAPALDSDQPWWDYESWSQSAAGAKSTTFVWNHDYGPLDWPRDGRELLRIKSRNRAYWKADALDTFDGVHWVAEAAYANNATLRFNTQGIDLRNLRRWSFPIEVSVRNLRSRTLPIAGSSDQVLMPRQTAVQVRPGIWAAGRDIHRGDAYSADVYVPQPSARELRRAGTTYSTAELSRFTHFTVRTNDEISSTAPLAGRALTIGVEAFGARPVRQALTSQPATELIENSDLARTYRLARRLLAGAGSPYEYVRAIERHLGDGFTYSEQPPDSARTLDGFLFESRIGYCQQFSGAMALLLRMGGVPARVVTGFAPGSLDRKTDQYVVRDLDAHSWVEAWFPGIGWVVFDPTPSTAPPRSQASGSILPSAGLGDARDLGQTRRELGTAFPDESDRTPWGAIVGGVLAAVAAWFGGRAFVRRRRAARTAPPTSELERALRIAGGGLAPATTLAALEARFAATPPAAGYVRALRAQRYAPAGGGPTPAQRRGLRRALARGAGPLGALRALRALPPRVRHHR
jgi:protein-glutamine gamma-glutamyltransferase